MGIAMRSRPSGASQKRHDHSPPRNSSLGLGLCDWLWSAMDGTCSSLMISILRSGSSTKRILAGAFSSGGHTQIIAR